MTRETVPRVFVCDPIQAIGYGLERVLRRAGVTFLGSTKDPSSRLTRADSSGPVIYVVDQSPGGVFGPALIKGLLGADPSRRIVAYSSYEDMGMIANAYEAGASAFVRKLASSRELLDAVFAVHALAGPRDRHYPGRLGEALADFYIAGGRAGASPRDLLTDRQLLIFRMVAEGLTRDEVAERLGLQRRSIGNYLGAIRRRLNIPREHFRSHAIEHRLIDPLGPGTDREGEQDDETRDPDATRPAGGGGG